MDPAALMALARHGEEVATVARVPAALERDARRAAARSERREATMIEARRATDRDHRGRRRRVHPPAAAVPAHPEAAAGDPPGAGLRDAHRRRHRRAGRAARDRRAPRELDARARPRVRRPDRRDRRVRHRRPRAPDHVRRPRGRAGRARPPATRNSSCDVRPEQPGDYAAIRALHRAAFAPTTIEAEIVDALRAAGDHVPELCLVAADDDAIVGHVMLSKAHVEEHEALGLGPIARRRRRARTRASARR